MEKSWKFIGQDVCINIQQNEWAKSLYSNWVILGIGDLAEVLTDM